MTTRATVFAAIDRCGADIDTWPDRALARTAREAAIADPQVRAALDEARRLSAGLDLVRAAADAEIEGSGAADRISRVVLASASGPRLRRSAWIAIAATLVLAAGLGVAVEIIRASTVADQPLDLVVLDPLVFGPMEADQP